MARQSGFGWDESYPAAADLSAKQFFFTAIDSAGKAALGVAATADGVLQNKPTAGLAAVVRHLGITRCVSDGSGTAIAAGDKVASDANGKAIKAATTAQRALGKALEASAADGTIISVALGLQGNDIA